MARKGDRAKRREDWGTDQLLFDKLNDIFNFDIDCAAEWYNAKCDDYISPQANAFTTPWYGKCFLNHPFGSPKNDSAWLDLAYEQQRHGNAHVVVVVTKASVGAKWWVKSVARKADNIVFLVGRPKFQQYNDDGNKTMSATPMYDVCLAIFGNDHPWIHQVSWWDWKHEK